MGLRVTRTPPAHQALCTWLKLGSMLIKRRATKAEACSDSRTASRHPSPNKTKSPSLAAADQAAGQPGRPPRSLGQEIPLRCPFPTLGLAVPLSNHPLFIPSTRKMVRWRCHGANVQRACQAGGPHLSTRWNHACIMGATPLPPMLCTVASSYWICRLSWGHNHLETTMALSPYAGRPTQSAA